MAKVAGFGRLLPCRLKERGPFKAEFYMQEISERFYREALRIRRVEEEIIRVYDTDVIKSPVHLSIGQEAVVVAVCSHLTQKDVVYATYRGHAAYLAKGGSLDRMVAELYGKSTGLARGKAGSMHLGDMSVNMIGTSAIVASGLPNALGHAFALQQQNIDAIVVCFFGEGATDEGVWHETMNFAGLRKLPILFVCENNAYAIYSHVKDRMAEPNLCERAQAYRVSATSVRGGDIFDMHNAAGDAIAAIRAGDGPRFLEIETYRWRDHVGPGEDRHIGYRPDEELDAWREADQVARLAAQLDAETRAAIDREVEEELKRAFDAAAAADIPDVEVMYDNVIQ